MNMKTGIYVPLITPFRENGEIDYRGLADATKFVLAKGVDGIYALGASAEFPLLSVEERKKCLETIVRAADGAEIIVQVGAAATEQSLSLAKHAQTCGVGMISAVAPYYFAYTFEQVKEYFEDVGNATPLPLMVYNAAQSRSYSLAEMESLMRMDKVAAMKYTNYNFFHLERLIAKFPDKKFFVGADEMFLAGQAIGAHGAIGTTYNYAGDSYIRCRELYKEGKVNEALEIVHKVNAMTELLFDSKSPLAMAKYVMRMQGLDILPVTRKPYTLLTEEMQKKIENAYRQYF